MASVFDEYAQECMAEQAKETALKLLKEGIPAAIIAKAISSLSIDEIKQLQQEELAGA